MKWTPIAELPHEFIKPGARILGLCNHEADIYHFDDGTLTTYATHAEGLGHVTDGPHVLEWGGEYHDDDYEAFHRSYIPNWWFKTDTDFEQAAFPTHFAFLPDDLDGDAQ
jgi:hypothetical protein